MGFLLEKVWFHGRIKLRWVGFAGGFGGWKNRDKWGLFGSLLESLEVFLLRVWWRKNSDLMVGFWFFVVVFLLK